MPNWTFTPAEEPIDSTSGWTFTPAEETPAVETNPPIGGPELYQRETNQEERIKQLQNDPLGFLQGGKIPANSKPPSLYEGVSLEEGLQRESLSIEQQLGNNKFDLNTTGIDELTRLKLFDAENPSDKLTILKRNYPDYEPFNLDTRYGKELFYRDKDSGMVYPVNPRGVDTGDIAEGATFIANEVAILSLGAGALAIKAGLGLKGGFALQGVAGAVAPYLKQERMELSDLEGLTQEELLNQATIGGLTAAGMELGGATFGRFLNSFRGAGGMEVSPAISSARQFASEQGLNPLSADEINFVVAALTKLSSQYGPHIAEKKAKSAKVFRDKFNEWSKEINDDPVFSNQFEIDKLNQDIQFSVKEQLLDPAVSIQDVAKSIPNGLKGYVKNSRDYFRSKYELLLDDSTAKGVEWDLGTAFPTIKEILDGVKLKGKTEEVIEEVTTTTPGVTGVKLPSSSTKEVSKITKGDDQRIAPKIGDIREQLAAILNSDPTQTDGRALIALRSQLFEASRPKGLTRDASEGAAYKAFKAIDEVIADPKVGSDEVGAAWAKKWRETNKEYASFKQNVDFIDNKRLVDNFDLEKTVDSLYGPLNHESLTHLKAMLPKADWEMVRGGFKSKIMNDPDGISASMNRFASNDKTLDTILTKNEQLSYYMLGNAQKQASNSGFKKFSNEITSAREAVDWMLNSGKLGQVEELIKNKPELKQALKASLLDDVANRASTSAKAVKSRKYLDSTEDKLFDQTAFMDAVTHYDKNGMLDLLFNKEEKERLTGYLNYANVTRFDSDMGANLSAMAEFGKWSIPKLVARGDQAALAAFHIASKRREGDFLTSPFIAQILYGNGTEPLNIGTIRELATTTTQLMNNYSRLMNVEIPQELLNNVPTEELNDNNPQDTMELNATPDFTGESSQLDVSGNAEEDMLGEVQAGIAKTPIDQLPEDLQAMSAEGITGVTDETTGEEFLPDTVEKANEANEAFFDRIDRQASELTSRVEKGLWDLVPNLLEDMGDTVDREDFINQIIDKTVKLEGGYVNHPDDKGGPTKFGITLGTLKSVQPDADINDVKNLTKERAKEIYLENYFYKPKVDKLPEPLQDLVFDMNVLHGPANSGKIIQRALNDIGIDVAIDGVIGSNTRKAINEADTEALRDKINDRRESFVKWIAKESPKQKKFLKGWLNRINAFRNV